MPAEMKAAIRDAGFSDYSLFLRDGLVIAYGRCEPDAVTCLPRVATTEAAKRWGEIMEGLVLDDTADAEKIQRFEEIWHLD
jgi:L-rhamnose mutarotase